MFHATEFYQFGIVWVQVRVFDGNEIGGNISFRKCHITSVNWHIIYHA